MPRASFPSAGWSSEVAAAAARSHGVLRFPSPSGFIAAHLGTRQQDEQRLPAPVGRSLPETRL